MFILFGKSHLVFDQDEIYFSREQKQAHGKYFLVYDSKRDSIDPTIIEWPIPSTTSKITFTCGTFVPPDDNLLVLCDDQKNAIVYDHYFKAITQFKIKKNAIKTICFKNNDGCTIFICDKSGDIYEFKFELTNPSKVEERLLLGHCSMLLDFTIDSHQRYIISADRDEKIRVTHYPNTYSIASYCLGHKEFVSSIKLIDKDQMLVSGSGDSNIKIWKYRDGTCLLTFNCESQKQEDDSSNNISSKKKSDFAIKSIAVDQEENCRYLCISFYTKPFVYLFEISLNEETTNQQVLSLKLVNKLQLNEVPIFICFDTSHINFLWIFSDSNEPVKLFEVKNNELIKSMVTPKIIEHLNQNECFKESLKARNQNDQLSLENLFKHFFDNPECRYQLKKLRSEGKEQEQS